MSRRASEFLGVALFAAALIWLVALATYEPTDPVWFFSSRRHASARQLRRPASARSSPSCRSSWSGYASYLIPAVLVGVGWHYFWCRTVDAVYTKAIGVGRCCSRCLSALLQLGVRQRRASAAGRSAPAARSASLVAAFTAST